MEEGRKTLGTTAHSHSSKNLPSKAAWVAHHPFLLQAAHHPTKPEPQHRSGSASHQRCPCGQLQQGEQLAGRWGRRLQRSCQPLPGCSSTTTAQHKPQKPMGFPGLISVSSSRSWLTSLPAPHQGKWEEKPGLIPLGSVMQNRGQQKEDPAPDWDMVVGCRRHPPMCNCSLMHTDWGAQKSGQDCGDVKRERARSQVKAVCGSWRDVPTNIQEGWRRVAHLGSKP